MPRCPCNSDGCPFNHQSEPASALPADAFELPEPWEGEPEAAAEMTARDENAGESMRWTIGDAAVEALS